MLSVVHGPFHPDLESALAERVAALLKEEGPFAIVAPSRRMADRLQRLLAAEKGLHLLDVHFHTFYSLAQTLIEDAGGLGGRLVSDPVFHDAVVDRLLASPQAGELFGGAERPRALASAVRASLRDLIDAGVSAEQIAEHFGDELIADEHERARLRALLALSRAYELELEKLGVVSPSGLTRKAAALAGESERLGRLREVLYYGFYDLTGLQLEFFEAVTSRRPSTLFYPYVKGHPAFRFAEDFFEQKLAAHSPQPAPRALPRPAAEPALERLFNVGEPAALPDGTLRLISASGGRDEVWAAAKEILRLVEDEGVKFERIGVVARALEPYRAALCEVFEENAIPFELGAGEPLLRRPVAKLAWNLLTLARRDFPAVVVEDILGSPYCARAPRPPALSAWRLLVERLAIRAGWLQWRKLEARLEDGLCVDDGEGGKKTLVSAQDARGLWTAVSEWKAALEAPAGTWAELAERAKALVEAELSLPKGAGLEERDALAAVLEAIGSLAAFDLLGAPPAWDAFLDALERKLKQATLERAQTRGVRVLSAMDARGESFEALFLLGLKERSFPRQIQEDPILREPARARLRHPAGYWIAQKQAGYEEERLLFYLCCASAEKRLYCVFPRSDEAGKAEVPSLYLRELCRAAGTDLSAARRVPRLPFERLSSVPLELLCPKEASLRLAWSGGDAAKYQKLVELPGEHLEECLERVPELNRKGEPGELDGVVPPPKAFLEEVAKLGLSPTSLDTLAQCGFKFFAEKLLGLSTGDDPSDKGEIAPWLRGQVYHAVLQRFYETAPKTIFAGEPVDGPLNSALEHVFSRYGWRELGVYPLLWQAARRRMSERLRDFVAWDVQESRASGLRPKWLEKELSGALPDDLPGMAAGLKLHGRADRIDVSEDGESARVVDYKSTWKQRPLPKLVAEGRHHQLPVYGELAKEALKLAAVDAAILSIEDSPEATGRERAHLLTAKDWAASKTAFYSGLAERVEALAEGRFPIAPDDGDFGHCAYCDFSTLCRKSHAGTRARSSSGVGPIKA